MGKMISAYFGVKYQMKDGIPEINDNKNIVIYNFSDDTTIDGLKNFAANMLNSTGSIDFFRPIQNNISFLDQLERAYTMDSYKINMENRDEEFNRVYNKQVKKTLDSCRDYLESRKTKGWTEKGNERFNNILKFYGRYRKEDGSVK